jgi:hypothetical protein
MWFCSLCLQDVHGEYTNTTSVWLGAVPVITSFRVYDSGYAAVLELVLPEGLAPDLQDDARPITCFPTLNLTAPQLGFMTQNRIFGNVVSGVSFAGYPNSIQGQTTKNKLKK